MDASYVTTPIAAFMAGLATSFHCAVMCGPLACAVGAKPVTYHFSRLASYTLFGGISGAAGFGVTRLLHSAPTRIAPWAMVVVLLCLALGLDKRFVRPSWYGRFMLQVRLRSSLGLLTPLLPCGPLWLMLGVAAASGSPLHGSLLLLSFVAGTIPLYAALHGALLHGRKGLSPLWMTRIQRSTAFLAACLLTWRASLPDGGCH